MGLMFNGHRHMPYGGVIGATNIDGGNRFTQVGNKTTTKQMRASLQSMDSRASVPDGCRHPVAWIMPQKAGGLSTRNNIIGSGGLTLSIQQARDVQALLVGEGGVLSPIAGLVVQVAALLIGAGGVLPVNPQLIANLEALLIGSGDVTASAAGLADLAAMLSGSGGVLPNNTALADLSATLRGYGELTPEGLRDSVWNALLSQYQANGTAGKALSLASSGGIDYAALAAAILAAAAIDPIASNVKQVNDLDIDGSGTSGDPWKPA